MDTVPPVRVRVLGALSGDGVKLTAAAAGKLTGTDRKVARRALEDLRALDVLTCPAEDATDDEDTAGAVWVTVDTAPGDGQGNQGADTQGLDVRREPGPGPGERESAWSATRSAGSPAARRVFPKVGTRSLLSKYRGVCRRFS